MSFEQVESPDGIEIVSVIRNAISTIDTLRPMSGVLHGNWPPHTSTLEVPRSTSEIMP
jgi:hypothetical protein